MQAIYVFLAVLMGGGLVLFGIGGNVSGGLLDALKQNKTSNTDVFSKRLGAAEQRAHAQPQNPAVWANLVKLRFQVAGTGDNYDDATGTFTDKGRATLRSVDQAWQHYLALSPKNPDKIAATYMVQAYGPTGLARLDKAVSALEVVIQATPKPTYDQYRNLAVLAFQAGNARQGALARARALELAPKDQRAVVKQQIDAAKAPRSPAAGQQTPGPTTTP